MTALEPTTQQTSKPNEIPSDVVPLMDSAREYVRSLQLNRVEKIDRSSALLNQISALPSAYDPGLEPHQKETRKRRRAELWSQRYALEELAKEDHCTPERRATLRARAKEKLPAWQRYAFANTLVRDIAADRELEECQISRLLAECEKEKREDVSDPLSYALTCEQITFISSLGVRRSRRRRFQARFLRGYAENILLDAPIRAPYAEQKFAQLVESCVTLSEVKELLAIWETDFRVERREGQSFVVGDGFEVAPV